MPETTQNDAPGAASSSQLEWEIWLVSGNQIYSDFCLARQNPAIFLAKDREVLTKLCSYSNNIAKGEIEGGNDGNSLLHEV
jgi:hypothetical protein